MLNMFWTKYEEHDEKYTESVSAAVSQETEYQYVFSVSSLIVLLGSGCKYQTFGK